jgi:hypothetical protein
VKLRADTKTPGLFISDEWRPGMPGTFALIAGVSAYAHLDGTANSYNLGQLYVSALTAYNVFDWLTSEYRYGSAPLAFCYLLLSPSAEERAFIRGKRKLQHVFGHAAPPTQEGMKAALKGWYLAMEQLSIEHAVTSRSFFFFSGHGLEITQDRQILLPSDYLRPPLPNVNEAISVANLRRACSMLHIGDQFCFLDACRNDHDALRGEDIVGERILPDTRKARPMNRNRSFMYASASGSFSYAPTTPDDEEGLSLFGQALVEGLTGRPALRLDCDARQCAVRLYALHDYVYDRVLQLIALRKAPVQQLVSLEGPFQKEPVVTYLPVTVAPAVPPATSPPPPPTDPMGDLPNLAGDGGSDTPRWSDWSYRREVFGSETMTAAWDAISVVSFATKRELRADEFTVREVRRDEDRRRYRVVIDLPAGAYWLKIALHDTAKVSGTACLLACSVPSRYELDLYRSPAGRLVRFDARYASESSSPIGLATTAWRWVIGRSALTSAAKHEFRARAHDDLFATTLFALMYFRWRGGLPQWVVESLAQGLATSPTTSDAAVLALEALVRAGKRRMVGAMEEVVRAVRTFGLPVFSDALSYLDRQLLDAFNDDAERPWMSDSLRTSAELLRARVRDTLHYFRPGGMFVALSAADPDALQATLVLPERRKSRRASGEGGPSEQMIIEEPKIIIQPLDDERDYGEPLMLK